MVCVGSEDFALVCSGYQVCAMKDNNSDNAMRCDDNDPKMRFVNLLGEFGPLCGRRWPPDKVL